MKPVNLTVHKNKVESRRKRTLAKELRSGVDKMCREDDLRAYAVVGIGADGKGYALWDTGAVLPLWAFADTVAGLLRADIAHSDVEEDWKPSLAQPKKDT